MLEVLGLQVWEPTALYCCTCCLLCLIWLSDQPQLLSTSRQAECVGVHALVPFLSTLQD